MYDVLYIMHYHKALFDVYRYRTDRYNICSHLFGKQLSRRYEHTPTHRNILRLITRALYTAMSVHAYRPVVLVMDKTRAGPNH